MHSSTGKRKSKIKLGDFIVSAQQREMKIIDLQTRDQKDNSSCGW